MWFTTRSKEIACPRLWLPALTEEPNVHGRYNNKNKDKMRELQMRKKTRHGAEKPDQAGWDQLILTGCTSLHLIRSDSSVDTAKTFSRVLIENWRLIFTVCFLRWHWISRACQPNIPRDVELVIVQQARASYIRNSGTAASELSKKWQIYKLRQW